MRVTKEFEQKVHFSGSSKAGKYVALIIDCNDTTYDAVYEVEFTWDEAEDLYDNLGLLLGKGE